MTRFLTTALLLLALTPLLHASDPTAEQFKALCAVAQDMDHSTIGFAYEDQITAALQNAMRDALRSCARGAKPGDEIDIVIVIAADGKVEHIFSAPGDTLSSCVAGKLEREKLPRPPKADWMQLINFYIKP